MNPEKPQEDQSSPENKTLLPTSFGFDLDTFTEQVESYIQRIRTDLDENPLTQEDLSAHYGNRLKQLYNKREEEWVYLTEQIKDPTVLYSYIEGIYNQTAELEAQGLDSVQVAHVILDEHEEKLWPLIYLVEHGLERRWGYHLAQTLMAIRVRRAEGI